MKRSIRILAGIAVILAMAFFYGFVAPNGALADDAASSPSAESTAPAAETTAPAEVTPAPTDATPAPADVAPTLVPSETPTADEGTGWMDSHAPSQKHMQYLRDKLGIEEPGDPLGFKTAKYSTNITSNKTLSGTYSKNLLIYPSRIVTVSGSATINGDIYLFGRMNVTGTLIVNGDLCVMPSGFLYTSGKGKIIVNKAAAGGDTKYPGGNLVVYDNEEYDEFGTLWMTGSSNITINSTNAKCGLFNFGTLIMVSNASSLTVNAPLTVFSGPTNEMCLNYGTLTVKGNFYQDDYYSADSFCPQASFKTVLAGKTGEKKIVNFKRQDYSYFTKLSTSGAFTYDTVRSVISLRTDLSGAADARSFAFNGLLVYLQGDLNGGSVTVKADTVCPANDLYFSGGKLTVNGNFAIVDGSRMSMETAGSTLTVNGNADFYGGGAYLSEGTFILNGNMHAYVNYTEDDPETYYDDSYPMSTFGAGQDFTTRIVGANRLLQLDVGHSDIYTYETHYVNSFSNLELAPGASIDPDSNVIVDYDFPIVTSPDDPAYEVVWNIPSLTYWGDLNGHKLTVNGDLYIPEDYTLGLTKGTLAVSGNVTVDGYLEMTDDADTARIGGNFYYNGDSYGGGLSAGKLYIGGNFSQSSGDYPYNIFNAGGTHVTIFDGTSPQTVHFDSSDSSSQFNKVVILNDNMDASVIPAERRNGDIVVSGLSFKPAITVSAGTISVSQDQSCDYLVLLPEGTADGSVTITPSFLDRYNGTSYMTDEGGNTVTSITVDNVQGDSIIKKTLVAHAFENLAQKTYTFKVEILNRNLGNLGTLPDGYSMNEYGEPITVDLPATAASFTFAPQPMHPDSKVTIDDTGLGSATVAVGYGESKTYALHVTAQDGTTTKDYSVRFTRHKPVNGITASAGTLAFDAATAAYDVYVPVTVDAVQLTVALNPDDNNEYLTLNGEDMTIDAEGKASGTLHPAAGGSEVAVIDARDKTGNSLTRYTVTVHRVQALTGIALSAGTLSPAFDPLTFGYTVYIPYNVASVRVTPAKTAGQTMQINGATASWYDLKPTAGFSAQATIICTGFGYTQTYTVTVYRVMPLSKIAVSTGTLSPAFSAGVGSYSVSVPATTASVTVSLWKTLTMATTTINGKDATFVGGVAAVKLSPAVGGSATAKIISTSINGQTYTYTVTVRRAALITGITTSAGKLTPSFSATRLSYTVANVPALTSQVKIAVVKAKTGVRSVAINGRRATYAYIKPPVGGSATATIVVLASDGRTKVTYKVTVKRNGLLSGIKLSTGKLSPAFSTAVPSYTVNVPADTPSVTVTPVKAAYAGVITINGRAASSVVLKPPVGGSATATIVVTGTDRRAKQTYTVKVVRHAPLKGIALAGGVLSPAFSPTVHAYNVTVPSATASVTITPLRFNTLCSYSINGGTPNTPYTAALEAGESETLTIVATASDHATKLTYTLTVSRAVSLESITTDASHTLSPSFGRDTLQYTIAANPVDNVEVSVAASSHVTCTMNGEDRTSIVVPCMGSSPVVVQIVCTSVDGLPPVTYTVTISWSE